MFFGRPQFLPKFRIFFFVAQFWTLGNGCGPPSWADPKVSTFDSAENTLCQCKTDVLYKKIVCSVWAISRSCTRLGNNHIGNQLAL